MNASRPSEHASDSSVAVAERPTRSAVKVAATKKLAVKQVSLRRLSHDSGAMKKGTIALIIDAKLFGAGAPNFLGGRTYETRELAIAAARKLGVKVLNA